MQKKPRHKKQPRTEELEREWLLLGEPTSPRNTIILDDDEQNTSTLTITPPPPTGPDNVTSNPQQQCDEMRQQASITSNAAATAAALSVCRGSEDDGSGNTSSDSSTDIDAAVDEYRQKVEVTTSGPSEKVLRIPSQESWQLSMILISCYFVGIFLCMIAMKLSIHSAILFGAGFVGEYSQLVNTHKHTYNDAVRCASLNFVTSERCRKFIDFFPSLKVKSVNKC